MTVQAYTASAGKYPFGKADHRLCFGDEGVFHRPEMEAKRYKILPHLFLSGVTVWTDANIFLLCDPEELVEELLPDDADMALFSHPYRDTVWAEFDTLKKDQRFAIHYLQQQLAAQRDAYVAAGLPKDAPVYECNFMIRRDTERVNRAMESWWAQICRWQWRDQVSLPFVLWRSDVKVATHPLNIREHPMFRYESQYG